MSDAPNALPYQVVIAAQVPASLRASFDRLDQQSLDELRLSDATIREFQDRFCSEGDISQHVLAVDRDEVIGMVLAYRRVLDGGRPPVTLGGIGSVYVAPVCRGVGIARRLVHLAMTELDRAGCDLAFLCANLDDPQLIRLYGGVGFAPLGRPYTYTGESGAPYTGQDGMIAPVRSPDVFIRVLGQPEPFDIGRGN